MTLLDGKVAIVTGSARGIGRATAELLSQQGAKVLINDLDGDAAEQTANEISGDTLVFVGDLTREGVPDKLVQRVIDEWGRVDILVNNAGYTLDAPIHKMSDAWFQRMLDIHSIVPFQMCRAVAPHMREPAKEERRTGREVFRKIVNVSSISGTMGNAGQANYSSGKSAVVGLTKTLAKEWGQFKINVNAVAFGYIETRLTASKEESNTMEIGGEKVQLGIPDQLRGMAPMLTPLGRPGTPEEAAGGIFLLCTPWANYIHGQVLNITGGQFGGMGSSCSCDHTRSSDLGGNRSPRGRAAGSGGRVAPGTRFPTRSWGRTPWWCRRTRRAGRPRRTAAAPRSGRIGPAGRRGRGRCQTDSGGPRSRARRSSARARSAPGSR